MRQIGKSGSAKATSALIVLGVLATLVIAGPAGAASMGLNSDDGKGPHEMDEEVSLTGSISIEESDSANISSVSLIRDVGHKNKEKVLCTFDINGNVISGCEGMTVILEENNVSFGYGYGSEGTLKYKIVIDVDESELKMGNNKLYLVAHTDNGDLTSEKSEVVVKPATPKNNKS